MYRAVYVFLWVVLSGVPAFVHADIIRLKQLVDSAKFDEAYTYAQNLLEEFEGDPEFDLQYGIAAIDSGHASEGVFALERVLFLKPNHALAKLELARGLFVLGDFQQARLLFSEVLALNPPTSVKDKINRFLAVIETKVDVSPVRFTSFVELFTGYDSNLNSGPESQPTLVTLSESALGRDDQFRQVRAGFNVDYVYNGNDFFNVSLHADSRIYDTEPELDYRNISLAGGHHWNRGTNQYSISMQAQQYSIDNDRFRDLLGVNLGWNTQLSKNAVLQTTLSWSELTYEQSPFRDSDQVTLGAHLLYGGQGQWNPIYFAGAFVGEDTPKVAGVLANAEVDRKFYGGNLGVQLSPVANVSVTPVLTYQTSQYQGEDFFFGFKREDDFYLMSLNTKWTLDKSWVFQANYSITRARSNIEIFNYDRQQVMLGLRYNF